MDWADVGSLLQALSILIASGTAIWGVSAWRREFMGKKHIELAEDVLARFYEARDIINLIRNPLSQGGEGSSRPQIGNETAQEKRIHDNSYLPFERYNNNRQPMDQLQALRYRFMAVFGESSAKPFEEIIAVVNSIFLSSMFLADYAESHHLTPTDEDEMKRLRQIVRWGSENDEVKARVDQAVRDVEALCQPYIQGVAGKSKGLWQRYRVPLRGRKTK